jgi:hypothetical protein
MADPFSLDEHARRYIDYPDPWFRLQGMRTARQAVEDQLAFLEAQIGLQINARIARDGASMAAEDVEDIVEQYREEVDALFPKVFRGGYVISLWSVFESCIKNVAEYTRKERNLPFGLQELRAGDFLKQVELFFEKVTGVNAFPDREHRKKLQELKDLRNALAHHDGSVPELPDSLRGRSRDEYLVRGMLIFRDLHHEFAVPTAAYAEAATQLVEVYLQDFSERVYKALHPVPLP